MKRVLVAGLIIFLVPLVFGLDSVNENGVSLSLMKNGYDYWTPDSAQELFNFTIDNQNQNYSFNHFNITIPSEFTFSDFLDNSLTSWECSHNSSVVGCNSSDSPLNLSSISVWFNVNSSVWSGENDFNWLVNFDNGLDMNITTGIDGKSPQFNQINLTYMDSDFDDGGNISQREEISLLLDVTDNGVGIDQVWFSLYNLTGNELQSSYLEENSTFTGEVTTDSLSEGNYTLKFFVNDSFANLNESEINFTVDPLPDLSVSDLNCYPINPYEGQNLTVFSNLTIIGLSDQDVKLVWKIDGEAECEYTVNLTSEINCTFTGVSGDKNISLEVDPDNNISESLENNNYQSVSISTNLNITILEVIYDGTSYNSSQGLYLEYNDFLALNVSVNYWNDDSPVENLGLDDFEVYDKLVTGSYENKSDGIVELDSSMNTSGFYLINYSVPDISGKSLEYGDHKLKFDVNDSESNEWEYFLDGPYLVVTFPEMEDSVNLDGASSKDVNFDIKITNEGNYSINGVSVISISANKEAVISESDINNCMDNVENLSPNESFVCEGLTVEVRESGTRVTVKVNGSYDSNQLEYEKSSPGIVVYDDSDDGDDDGNSGTAADDEEWEGESPSGGGLSSKSEPTVSKDYLEITTFPEKIELEQGKRLTQTIEIDNIDEIEFQKVKLKVTGIEPSWLTILPSGDVEIEPLDSTQFRVVFDIPEDANVKDFQGEFEVSSSFDTKKEPFTLTILPGPTLKTTINQTIQDYQQQIAELEAEIEDKKANGYDTTEAEAKLNKLKEEFNKLLSYRDGGNYKSAYDLLDETEDLIEETANVLSGAVVLSTSGKLVDINNIWLMPVLFGLLLIIGGYTWWGKYFKVNDKFLGRFKGKKSKPKVSGREKELEMIASKVRKTDAKVTKTKKKAKKKPKTNLRTSDRIDELDIIKTLIKGK